MTSLPHTHPPTHPTVLHLLLGHRGNVSTDNSGGFASVRSRNMQPAVDLGAYTGIELRLKVRKLL